MRIRTVFFSALLLGVSLGAANAQPHQGDIYTVTSNGQLWQLDRNGRATSLASVSTISDGITMSYDNRAVYWTGYGNTASTVAGTINEWRNNANTTILSTTDFLLEEVLLNQDGEVAFTGVDTTVIPNVTGLFKWTGGSNITTITTTANLGVASFALDAGLDINTNTGNYVLAARTGSQLYDVAEDGTVTSLIANTNFVGAAYTITQDRRDGAIYKSSFGNTYQYVLNGSTTTLTPTGGTTPLFHAIRMDRASTPDNARLLYAVYQTTTTLNNFIHTVQDPGGTPAVTSSTPINGSTAGVTTGIVLFGEKNVASAKTGTGAYDLNFNFPGESGNAYLAAVGAAGFSPGFPVSGLNVCLNVDSLVILSARNLLKPFFDSGPGVLDTTGNARGSIALGVDNLGVLVHIVALTVQGGQVRSVSAPHVMRL